MTPHGDGLGRGHVIAKTREVIRRAKIARRAAHGLAEFLDGAREITLGHGEPAARKRDRRFGLGDIGPGDLAHLEPVLGRAQLFLEQAQVVFPQRHEFAVADHVHVGPNGGQEHRLFDAAQRLPRGEDRFPGRLGQEIAAPEIIEEKRAGDADIRAVVRGPARVSELAGAAPESCAGYRPSSR